MTLWLLTIPSSRRLESGQGQEYLPHQLFWLPLPLATYLVQVVHGTQICIDKYGAVIYGAIIAATSPHHGHNASCWARLFRKLLHRRHIATSRGVRRRKHTRGHEAEGIMALHQLSIYFVNVSVSSCNFSIYCTCLTRLPIPVIDDADHTVATGGGLNPVILVYSTVMD
jgi:hypothetical protein